MKRYEIAWYELREGISRNGVSPIRRVLFYKGFTEREKFDRFVKKLRKNGFEIAGMIVDFHKIPEEEFANY